MTQKNKSPLLRYRKNLIKNTAYPHGRAAATGTAILNTLAATLLAAYLLNTGSPGLAAITLIANLILWTLLNTIAQALFDLADAKLQEQHHQAITESKARSTHNTPKEQHF